MVQFSNINVHFAVTTIYTVLMAHIHIFKSDFVNPMNM